jgi:hypothetical protein
LDPTAIRVRRPTRPGRIHDITAVRTEGVDALPKAYRHVEMLIDAGYQGLAKHRPIRPALHR